MPLMPATQFGPSRIARFAGARAGWGSGIRRVRQQPETMTPGTRIGPYEVVAQTGFGPAVALLTPLVTLAIISAVAVAVFWLGSKRDAAAPASIVASFAKLTDQ